MWPANWLCYFIIESTGERVFDFKCIYWLVNFSICAVIRMIIVYRLVAFKSIQMTFINMQKMYLHECLFFIRSTHVIPGQSSHSCRPLNMLVANHILIES